MNQIFDGKLDVVQTVLTGHFSKSSVLFFNYKKIKQITEKPRQFSMKLF